MRACEDPDDRLYLSALGVAVVLLVASLYLFAAVLNQPLTSRPVELTVELEQPAGCSRAPR